MNPVLRNILAVFVGLIVGSAVNGALIHMSPMLIAPPAGVDVTSAEGLQAGMHLFQPKHFLMPFLAHALGTFAGAFVAAKIAATRKLTFAMVIAFFFLFGGLASVFMLPSPLWYTLVDLLFAYIPMGYLAARLAK